MSLHRVKLLGDKRRREETDEALLERCAAGEIGWVEALGLGDDDVDELRSHGRALCQAGRFADALDVLSVLPLFGSPDRHDALYLGFCHEGLGDLHKADECFLAAKTFNDAIEAELARRQA